MSFIEIDEIKTLLENEVADKKKELVDNLDKLEEEREENYFLNEIAEDYKKYNRFIIQQKEKQVIELLKILDYLDELLETQAVTQYTLDHTKTEQKRVISEIKTLQQEMNGLIKETE